MRRNLIGNAVKFRRDGVPPEIHVAARQVDSHWLLSVRDNGIGIKPQHQDKIFLIFQRLHTREKYPGTGIGLAICKKIVEQHGGRLWIESQLGQGCTFYFTLPQRSKNRPKDPGSESN
jgi:chemotaxis family two-component system sensor kinase Cph1